MSQYVLLYRSTNEQSRAAMGTPEQAEKSMAKWRAWIGDMKGRKQLTDVGMPLDRTGMVIAGAQKLVTDGPYTETKEVVGGFSIIEAWDLAQAVKIASGCPILEGGGSVEVRPVMPLDV